MWLIDDPLVCRRKLNEIIVLEKSIKLEKEKQMMHKQHVMKRGEISLCLRWIKLIFGNIFFREEMKCQCYYLNFMFPLSYLRWATQHILDVMRHVGTQDYYKALEFPTVNLQLPLLSFNKDLPEVPRIMEDQSKIRIIRTNVK